MNIITCSNKTNRQNLLFVGRSFAKKETLNFQVFL